MPTIKLASGKTIQTDNQLREVSAIHGHGSITREYNCRSVKPEKRMCQGCRDDFYNGKNPYGVTECWGFKTARVVDKVGHSSIYVTGGIDGKMTKTLSCFNATCK
jgi:hypothetical protein